MSKFDYFILENFLNEIIKLGYNYKDLETTNIWKFRYICYKFNYFMKHIPIPNIKKKSFYEAVFIDFRVLPNIEFIIRNAIFKLGNEWSHTIVCGNTNYKYILDIVKNINKHINIIKLDHDNLTHGEYSNLLTTEEFWNSLYGEKILIYQEDSIIFNKNIDDFYKYDFIGAPFQKNSNDTPNCVGNGGFSFRTKLKMIEVIKRVNLKDTKVNSTTINYMKLKGLEYPPEDVYFSKNMQEYNIGDVASWDEAYKFSSEQIFNPHSFAGHQFWIGNKEWQNFLKNKFNYSKYKPKSDLNKYLLFKRLPLEFNKNKNISNAFDIDFEFFCIVNNIEYVNELFTLEYIDNIGLDGFIYHLKQLTNIFGNQIELYKYLNNIYVFYKNDIYTIQYFINKFIYNSSFGYLENLLIKKKYDILNDNYDTLLLVFLGNEELSLNLLDKIINYKNINSEFNISFCININMIKNTKHIKNIIKENFDFYAIYYSKEMGTDITPTLLMYNDIIKKHNIKHILKFHTKTISHLYNNLTNFLLKNPINFILRKKRQDCNCIGPEDSYIPLMKDVFNNKLKYKYNDVINLDNKFVAGTIFYTTNDLFNKVLEFIKNNNYRSYLLNNLYENNSINQEFSPIHFLERVFGSIKL